MKVLLDTHTALWWINEYEKLSTNAQTILSNDENILYLSIVSAWEISIKVSLDKLIELKGGVKTFLNKFYIMPVNMLSITTRHIETIETLPFIHRDPFDRMLIATAKIDNLTILTADKNIHKYDVMCEW